MPKKIHVIMDGGTIQDILNVPLGVEVIVRDFDVDGVDFNPNTCGKVNDSLCTEVYWDSTCHPDPRAVSELPVDEFIPILTQEEWDR